LTDFIFGSVELHQMQMFLTAFFISDFSFSAGKG